MVRRLSTRSAGAISTGRAGIEPPSDFEARKPDFDGGFGACRGEVKSTAIDGNELGPEMLSNEWREWSGEVKVIAVEIIMD